MNEPVRARGWAVGFVMALVLGVMAGPASAQDLDDPLGACPVDAPAIDVTDRDAIPEAHVHNVACAAALDVVRGFADGEYKPRLPVTRAQLASFIFRTLQTAQVELPEPTGDRFSDVGPGNAHDEAIHRLAAAGIVQGGPLGMDEALYGPQLRTRRDQMASFLLRAAGLALEGDPDAFAGQPGEDTDRRFSDVPPGNAHFGNINAANDLDIARGSGDGLYRPRATTRRDQMASFVVRLLNVVAGAHLTPGGTISGTVTDGEGEPIGGASVTTDGQAATTDAAGGYRIDDLAAGSYTVTAAAVGYTSSSQAAAVAPGATTTVDFALAVDDEAVVDGLACGDAISQDTTLTGDLGPCPGHGLVIESDGVVLDLAGHAIIGDPQPGGAEGGVDRAGVLLRDTTGATVTGGMVQGFGAGVAIAGGGGHTVRALTATGNASDGIALVEGTHGNTVTDTNVGGNGRYGLALSGPEGGLPGATGNTLHANTGHGNGLHDGADLNAGCADNDWAGNSFGTVSQACVQPPPAPPVVVAAWNNHFGNGLDVRWSEWIAQHPLQPASAYTIHASPGCTGSPVAVGSAAFWTQPRPAIRDVAFSSWAAVVHGETYYLHVRAGTERSSTTGAQNEESCTAFVAEFRPGA